MFGKPNQTLTTLLEIAVEAVLSSMLARLQLSRTSCDLPATLQETSWGSPPLVLRSTASLLQRFTLPSRFCRALREVVDAVAPAPPSDRMESAICMSGLVGVARDRFAVVDQHRATQSHTEPHRATQSHTEPHRATQSHTEPQSHTAPSGCTGRRETGVRPMSDVQPMSGRPG